MTIPTSLTNVLLNYNDPLHILKGIRFLSWKNLQGSVGSYLLIVVLVLTTTI
ncbi:protein of unknown function [Candidatus Nitrosocosmicus franklandus]|uniref:Uncharacterized protein n=1 Tax=Candidatus Nitrosocosmicus franklandianus TaxID=1798806 RepID=A0A484IH57_9ARCH|nr:protein of unknown function [Candidatus Nitrosocosmicus franklandus]